MNEILERYYNEGWLIKQSYLSKNLTIWNYSRKCAWDKHWDSITMSCRGLVVDDKGKIVSQCLKKFFNYEELNPEDIPNEPFEMTEKMDGQYGNLFYYDNEWIITSRGSFESIYAKRAWKLLQKYDYKKLSTDYTYLFEIIFKEGRIVLKYDFEDLIMLARINIETGIEESIYNQGFEALGFKLVKRYDGINDFKDIKTMISNDAEGFVIKFKSGFRMKIKGDGYCRLHRIITQISSRDIWEYVKDNKPLNELLENVPDEFDGWVREQVKAFKEGYMFTEREFQLRYLIDIGPTEHMTRKDVALKIMEQPKDMRGIYFSMYDKKNYSQAIWRKLYPAFEKPFNNNDDENNIK
jgi:RNA ligase